MSTSSNAIDIGLLGAFLFATLILGIQVGRKVTSVREYAVGGKDFSTVTLTATIVATWMNGGTFLYVLSNVYTIGLKFLLVVLIGDSLNLFLSGQVLAIRMSQFLHHLSVAEVMGELYGSIVRVITSISGVIGRIGHLAIQLQIVGKMVSLVSGLQGPEVTIAAATVVITYSAFGGIRSVTITDVLQFITFSVFLPILAFTAWTNLKGSGQIAQVLATAPFDLRKVIGWNYESLSSLDLMLYFIIPSLSPAMFQRILVARDVEHAKQSFTYAAGINFLIILIVSWVAILLLTKNPNLESDQLLDYIINCYAYVGLKGLMAIGIIALAMSTADSDLNSFSVLVVHDILKPIFPSFRESMTATRLCSFFVGTLGLMLALHQGDILGLVLLTASFYMPIVTVPLLMSIFGFRSSPKSLLVGMVAGFLVVLTWDHFFAYTGLKNIIPGMLANLVGLMGTHYLLGEEGGWKASDKGRPLAE